ncbi:MAG: hypothetical protein R2867_22335 [Caldilineaceae bacterium]
MSNESRKNKAAQTLTTWVKQQSESFWGAIIISFVLIALSSALLEFLGMARQRSLYRQICQTHYIFSGADSVDCSSNSAAKKSSFTLTYPNRLLSDDGVQYISLKIDNQEINKNTFTVTVESAITVYVENLDEPAQSWSTSTEFTRNATRLTYSAPSADSGSQSCSSSNHCVFIIDVPRASSETRYLQVTSVSNVGESSQITFAIASTASDESFLIAIPLLHASIGERLLLNLTQSGLIIGTILGACLLFAQLSSQVVQDQKREYEKQQEEIAEEIEDCLKILREHRDNTLKGSTSLTAVLLRLAEVIHSLPQVSEKHNKLLVDAVEVLESNHELFQPTLLTELDPFKTEITCNSLMALFVHHGGECRIGGLLEQINHIQSLTKVVNANPATTELRRKRYSFSTHFMTYGERTLNRHAISVFTTCLF